MKINHAPPVEYTFKENKDDWIAVYHVHANLVEVFIPGVSSLSNLYERYEHEAIHAALANLGIDFFEDEEDKIIESFIWFKETTI